MRYGLMTRLDSLHSWAGSHGHAPSFVALHGFSGGGEDFGVLAPLLGWELLAPDLPGHGGADAPHAPEAYQLARVVAGVAELLDRQNLQKPVLLGYSMGGRLALSFAAAYPDRLSALVLVGASPGLENAAEAAARVAGDEALADRIEAEGVPAFVSCWSGKPLIASQARIAQPYRREMLRRRLGCRPHGLANSLRGMGTGGMPPLWEALPALALPVLLLTGAEDSKFEAIARQMLARLPDARHEIIPGAGHCAHLEQPAAAAAAIQRFMGELNGL